MASASDRFTVTRICQVERQINELVKNASTKYERRRILAILQAVVSRLEQDPTNFGDPIYSTKKRGGKVFYGHVWPVSVQYAVYEAERVVCLLKVQQNAPLVP